MRIQGAQDLADVLEPLRVFRQGVEHRGPGRNDDRDHDVAEALPRSSSHHPPDGLDDVDLARPRVQERDCVQRGHVHAFGEEPRVHHCPERPAFRGLVQFPQGVATVDRARAPVDVLRLDYTRAAVPSILAHPPGCPSSDLRVLDGSAVPPRARDAAGVGDDPGELARDLRVRAGNDAVHGQGEPQDASDLLRGRAEASPFFFADADTFARFLWRASETEPSSTPRTMTR